MKLTYAFSFSKILIILFLFGLWINYINIYIFTADKKNKLFEISLIKLFQQVIFYLKRPWIWVFWDVESRTIFFIEMHQNTFF